jgi:hypothetical protein
MDDVRRIGGEIAGQLPSGSPDADAYRFDASSAPRLPPSATSDAIVIARSHHDYNGCWRADALHLYATRQTLRSLGVIVLASLFAPPDARTDIALTHPASDIRTLRVRPPATDGTALSLTARWYDYQPRSPRRFPWDDVSDPYALPALRLTDDEEVGGVTDAQWLARDTVVGFGTPDGVARLGQLLIDAGDPAADEDEYRLEGEAGERGVAPLSAELIIWLPGSLGWDPRYSLD